MALGESTDKRAEFIARDQTNKATSVINRARQRDLGITKAVWMHMRGGKHPRESHVDADGEEFDLDKGMFLDGKWIQPGEEPNCGCQAGPVIPEFQ
ncbi:Phage Mu protein F like protein [compost metagenome]